MSSYSSCNIAVQTIGPFQYCQVNGQRFKRKRGTETWIPVQSEALQPVSQRQPLILSLITQWQSWSEPAHWSLFVARENELGMVYQVKGDGQLTSYQPSIRPTRRWTTRPFINMYELATLSDQTAHTVKYVVEHEPPPCAETHRDINDNCQYWVVRVVEKLAARGIVSGREMEMVAILAEPL